MEFMIWATRSVHVFSAVVWLGGLLYMGGVLYPVFRHERMTATVLYVGIERRFMGFVWMCVWTTAITGVLLMLFSPKFQFGSYRTIWEYLFLLKQIIYLTMVVVAILSGKIVKKMVSISASASAPGLELQLSAEHEKMLVRRRLNIVFGLVVLLISTRMVML
jgi:uncharacterized membrane protein